MTSYFILKTAQLGDLLLTATATHLTGIYFADRAHAPAIADDWELNSNHPILQSAASQLHEFLNGTRTTFSIPLNPAGTPFQQEIWQQIAAIPFGQIITYSQLATRAGSPEAIRAAGAATGQNPISIIVPCHRIIGKSGKLQGYAGGLDRKKHLLELEQPSLLRGMGKGLPLPV